jgi:hypothetical protein
MSWLFAHSILSRIKKILNYCNMFKKIPRYAKIICSFGFKRILLPRKENILFKDNQKG